MEAVGDCFCRTCGGGFAVEAVKKREPNPVGVCLVRNDGSKDDLNFAKE